MRWPRAPQRSQRRHRGRTGLGARPRVHQRRGRRSCRHRACPGVPRGSPTRLRRQRHAGCPRRRDTRTPPRPTRVESEAVRFAPSTVEPRPDVRVVRRGRLLLQPQAVPVGPGVQNLACAEARTANRLAPILSGYKTRRFASCGADHAGQPFAKWEFVHVE